MRAIAGPESGPSDTGDEPLPSYRPVFRAALAIIVCLVGTFGGWGMFARLDAAVVTQGVILAESQRKTVEHLEGGILEKLLVKPGDRVEQGQVVATLDGTQVKEQLAQLQANRLAIGFDVWRLEAEQAGAPSLDQAAAPQAPEAERAGQIEAQRRLFEARRLAHDGQRASLQRQIDQLQAQIEAGEAQSTAAERQLELWQHERDLTATLVDKGATPRQKLMELDRNIAQLQGQRDEQRGLTAAARDGIAKAKSDIETLEQQRLVEIAEHLSDGRRQLQGLLSQIRAAEDVLERRNLRAPQTGYVVDIHTVTPGAIVRSGTPVMDIVPEGDRLVIETRLPPDTIDTVYVGRKAMVHLTAYHRAKGPVVDGTVIFVSADLVIDERDGTGYFDARVAIDPSSLAKFPGVTLSAGMPVEVAIQTGERRAGDYFLEPVLRHLRRAMHEE